MKRKFLDIPLVILVILALALFSCSYLFFELNKNPFQREQEELALTLKVNIKTAPNPKVFPVAYFHSVLRPGMTIKQVHEIIKGYKLVYQCYGIDELYYYFRTDEQAIRFLVTYSDQGLYEKMESEDTNSRTLSIGDCTPGRLSE